MSASRSGNLILINIHDFLLNKDDLMSLLYIDEDETDEAPPEKVYKEKVFGPPKKRGRKPLYEKFPGLIDVVNNFVKTAFVCSSWTETRNNRDRFITS